MKINTLEKGKLCLRIYRGRSVKRSSFLTVVQAFKLTRGGCEAYLTHLIVENTEKMRDVVMVKEFVDPNFV